MATPQWTVKRDRMARLAQTLAEGAALLQRVAGGSIDPRDSADVFLTRVQEAARILDVLASGEAVIEDLRRW